MPERRHESVPLRRAVRGGDLWAAIEAAQYGRLVDLDEPRSAGEREAMAGFLQRFGQAVEGWEALAAERQAEALTVLAAQLDSLARQGLYVHCGRFERRLAARGGGSALLPIAVLAIGRDPGPDRRVLVPQDLEVEG